MKNKTNKSIAILNTGDELVHGDILNSNSQAIAQMLFENAMTVDLHLSVSDQQAHIEAALTSLLQQHSAVIVTGGLGPTSDDRTRFAIAAAIHSLLIFDDATWNAITSLFKQLGYDDPPESNKHQALFPVGATIFHNPKGTAAGCGLVYEGKWIFMLPGPPSECLPMFKNFVLPILASAGFSQTFFYQKWLLFGVSEGHIAEKLDPIAAKYDCMVGYRITYPYIEFKISSRNESEFKQLCSAALPLISPYLLDEGQAYISKTFLQFFEESQHTLAIMDQATGGRLQTLLLQPKTYERIFFDKFNAKDAMVQVAISGLKEYWENQATILKTLLEIEITQHKKTKRITHQIPNRAERTLNYAVELICYELWSFLRDC
jgi:nicotinamide-nucleotide amidase